jgi:hypothetical protein
MSEAEKETCLDCLHRKVSAESTDNNRLCYCAKEGKEARLRESFWLEKKVCGKFDSMGPRIAPRVPRRPLLKGADFLSGPLCG